MAHLSVEGYGFSYPRSASAVLDDVTFSLERGEYVLVVGKSGSGKTTLLRSLKTALAPHGLTRGCILYGGEPLGAVPLRDQAAAIGYVGQDVDAQLVCDDVGHELAFGLENLGVDAEVIRARVAEMAAYLGLEPLIGRSVHDLSGGEKQLVNLASVMVMRPRLLLLDEPCAQLDPLAARTFIDAVSRMNRERGVTVVMVEHRAEEIFGLASRVLVIEGGRLAFDGAPAEAARWLLINDDPVVPSLPAAARIAFALDPRVSALPLDTGSGRLWFQGWFREHAVRTDATSRLEHPGRDEGACAIELREVSFRYAREMPDVLHRVRMSVPRGGIHAVIGGNGSGKSTLLEVMAGVLKPTAGRILYDGASHRRSGRSVALLPQEPIDLFAHDSVRASIEAACAVHGERAHVCASELMERFDVSALAHHNPHDLSAGELQRAALVMVLLGRPDVLLLDEATRSLDAPAKRVLASLLRELADEGTTIVLSSHDMQFCAENVETVAVLFGGQVVAQRPVHALFADNAYYTTNPAIISRPYLTDAITVAEVVDACRA